jgi:hypothetical protein
MPRDIQPSEAVARLFYITTHHHPNLVLFLRERRSSCLQHMFTDAEEIEDNLRSCGNLSDQIWDEDLCVEEQEKVYEKQKSDLDAKESEEKYEHERSDPSFHSLQDVNVSFPNLYYSPNIEANQSDISTVIDVEHLCQQDDSPCEI